MLGYANLAKSWSVAHSGGEHADPTLGMIEQRGGHRSKTNCREGQCSPAQAAVEAAGRATGREQANARCSCAGISAHALPCVLDSRCMSCHEFGDGFVVE